MVDRAALGDPRHLNSIDRKGLAPAAESKHVLSDNDSVFVGGRKENPILDCGATKRAGGT